MDHSVGGGGWDDGWGGAFGADLVTVDFNSATTGNTTAGDLDEVTSGGTWALGSGNNVHQEIHTDAGPGNKALFSGSHVENQTCTGPGATLTLNGPVAVADLSVGNDLVFSFKTGSSVKTGWSLEPSWYILDDGGGTLARIKLDDGNISIDGGSGSVSMFGASACVGASWDSSSDYAITMTVTIDSTGLLTCEVSDTDSSGSCTKNIGIGVTVASLETTWPAGKGQGLYLNDILITGPSGDPEVKLDNQDVLENVPVDSVVGELSVLLLESETFTYTLPSYGDNANFDISGSDLVTDVLLNNESHDPQDVRVVAEQTSGTGIGDKYTNELEIAIIDVDVDLDSLSVLENSDAGTVVGALSIDTTDPVSGETFTYAVDNANFQIDGTDLETAVELDHETQDPQSVELVATQTTGTGAGNKYTNSYSIAVGNVVEATRFFVRGEISSVAEDGDQVAQLEAMTSDYPPLTFGENATYDHDKFAVATDGVVTLVGGPYPQGETYDLEVTLADSNGGGADDSMVIRFTVVAGTPEGTVFVFK